MPAFFHALGCVFTSLIVITPMAMTCQCVAQVRSFDLENPLFQFELGEENEIHNYRLGCPPDPAVSHGNPSTVELLRGM